MIPHQCRCSAVARCDIFTHPSSEVQAALNTLMDAMAEFDDATGSFSTLSFTSVHSEGKFTSVTKGEANAGQT